MTIFGGLYVPDELLARDYALRLLGAYLQRDDRGHRFSGAAFDTYPALPAAGPSTESGAPDAVTDSDLIALTLLSIRVTGHEALIITHYRAKEIHHLLARIPRQTRIEDDGADRLLARGGPAWELWDLLCKIRDRTKDARLGPVAAGKLLARKRPGLIPISDSRTASVFKRPAPDRDTQWWEDVRGAARDPRPIADGTTLWKYLTSLRAAPGAGHLPVLRVLDILAWMHEPTLGRP